MQSTTHRPTRGNASRVTCSARLASKADGRKDRHPAVHRRRHQRSPQRHRPLHTLRLGAHASRYRGVAITVRIGPRSTATRDIAGVATPVAVACHEKTAVTLRSRDHGRARDGSPRAMRAMCRVDRTFGMGCAARSGAGQPPETPSAPTLSREREQAFRSLRGVGSQREPSTPFHPMTTLDDERPQDAEAISHVLRVELGCIDAT